MAEVATDRLPLRTSAIGWPLDELWVSGALLEPAEEVDHGAVVLMIGLPPDEVPWLALHPTAEWIGEQLRLGKRPIVDLPPDDLAGVERPKPAGHAILVCREWARPRCHRRSAIRSRSRSGRGRPPRGGRAARRRVRGGEGPPSIDPRALLGPDWRRANRHHTSPNTSSGEPPPRSTNSTPRSPGMTSGRRSTGTRPKAIPPGGIPEHCTGPVPEWPVRCQRRELRDALSGVPERHSSGTRLHGFARTLWDGRL